MKKIAGCLACVIIIAFAVTTWRELEPASQNTILGAWSLLARTVARIVDSLLT